MLESSGMSAKVAARLGGSTGPEKSRASASRDGVGTSPILPRREAASRTCRTRWWLPAPCGCSQRDRFGKHCPVPLALVGFEAAR